MKKLSSVTISGGLTVDQATTLSGVVSVGGIGTGAYTSVLVRNSSNQMLYRNYSDFVNDISGSLNLSGYVPTSRTLTINGTTYDLSADRTWTINTVAYTSRLQHQVKAGVAINKGQAVYVTSADGTNMIVGLASNASEATSSKTMGLLDATVSTNGFANVVTEGLLAGLDTSTAGTEGDPVWLGTGGNLIYGLANKPYAPAHLVFIGIVTRKNANNGEIFVKVQNGFELKEIHDVDLITNAPTAGQLLRYDSDGLWKNWSPNYLTAETDTLATVTGRGATTSTNISVNTINIGTDATYGAAYRSVSFGYNGDGSNRILAANNTSDGMYFMAATGQGFNFRPNGGTANLVVINSTGNVGIGTTSPGYKLEVNGTGYFNNTLTVNGNIQTLGSANQYIKATGFISNQIGQLSDFGVFDAGFYVLSGGGLQFVGAGANRVTMLSNGNVGIGTTAPIFNLQVGANSGTLATTTIRLQNSYLDTNGYYGFNIDAVDNGVDGHDLRFLGRTSPTGTFSELVRIKNSGNVGIGTTSPTQKLDVAGGDIILSSNATYIRSKDASGNTPRMFGINPSNDTYIGPIDSYAGGAVFYGVSANVASQTFYTGATARLHIASGGNVGIGFTTPQKKLDVYGTGIVASFGGTFGPGDFAGIHFGYSESNSNNDSYKKSALVFERTDNNNQGGNASGKIHFLLNNAISTSANSLTHSVVTIDSDANGTVGSVRMGIGTRNPSSALEVIGSIRNKNASPNSNYSQLSTSEATLTLSTYSINTGAYPADIIFSPASTEAMRINSSGKVSIGTTDTNSDKSDFTVYTGGTTTLALAGNLLRVGDTDVNWGVALRSNGVLETYGQNLYLGSAAGNYPVTINPNGTNSVSFYQTESYLNTYTRINYNWGGGAYGTEAFTIRGTYPSIALRSTNANFKWLLHTDSAGNFRWYTGSDTDSNTWTNRFTFGTDNNFYVDYGHVYVSGGNSTQWNTAYSWGNHATAGYLTSVSDVWVNTTGDTMTGDLTFANNADNVRINKNNNWLNLYDPWNNIHLRNGNSGYGIYIDSTIHYWRPHDGSAYWMTLSSTGLGIGTGSPSYKLDVAGITRFQNRVRFANDLWNLSDDGYSRLYFSTNGRTYYGSGDGHEWRSAADTSIGFLTNAGNLILKGTNAFTTGGTATLSVIGDIISFGASDSELSYFRRVGTGQFQWQTYSSGNNGQIHLQPYGGNVGIGTSSPSEKLHVSGAAIFDGGAGNSSTDSVVYITKSNNNDWGLYVNASGLDYGMYTRVSPSAGYAIGVNNGTDWTTRITGNAIIYLGEKNAIEGNYDTWLRLNNSNHYASGVYTPGVMRADGGFNVSGSTVWHAGNDGSGSGLDADLLDGQHASYFINTSNIGSQSVSYANSAGEAGQVTNQTGQLLRFDNRIISPSETTAGYLQFGFTSWTNDNNAPYADYLHLRSYTDASGGNDNLVMFLKSDIGMRIYQQSWGTTAPYSSYVDVWTTGNFTQSNVNNWNTAYGWGNHASQGYATTSYVTTQINNLINGAPGALDTLDELAAALGDDANFATTVTNSIAGKVSKSGDTMTSSAQQVLNVYHGAATGDFNDALFLKSIASGQQVQIGMATLDADGDHHRVSLRAYKGTQTLEGVFGIALRQPSAAHIQRFTLDYLGNVTIGGFLTESSSLKLKENVETSEGNLEKVVNLRPVTYNKIGSQTTELGLIAEEVAEVYPEFVQYDENGEPVGVNYSRLTAALIGAVKELTNQVQELNKKING